MISLFLTHTVPSLQGTLAKRTKPTLQPNFAKEPFRPSRSNVGLRDCANLIDKLIENINRQCLTCGHKTFGVMWLFDHPATHQSLVTVDRNAARSPKRFYTAKPLAPSTRDILQNDKTIFHREY
jgi:hypothetical protein